MARRVAQAADIVSGAGGVEALEGKGGAAAGVGSPAAFEPTAVPGRGCVTGLAGPEAADAPAVASATVTRRQAHRVVQASGQRPAGTRADVAIHCSSPRGARRPAPARADPEHPDFIAEFFLGV